MRKFMFLLSAMALAGCDRSTDADSGKQTAANAARPRKPRPAYCFFKDSETKGWAATRGKDGNIVVKGKAYREDPRYKALFGPPAIKGTTVEIAPTITDNDTGYAAVDNWWDIKASIPGSAAIDSVTVKCGEKTLVELKVPPKK